MIRICFITTTAITLSTFVVETARALYDSGEYDVSFICSDDAAFAAALPKYIHYYPITMERGISLKGLLAVGKIYRLFKIEKFDVIQFSTPNASLYASIAGKISRIKKRIYAQWGIRYVGMNGGVRTIFKAIEHFICYLATDIRAVSRMNLEFAVSEGLYKRDKAVVLGKGGTIGIDLSIYDISQKSSWRKEVRDKLKLGDMFTFGFAGRISVDKGGRELITAFRQLLCTDPGIQLMIVGPNEIEGQSLDDTMKWALQNKQVFFTGFIQKDEMCKYYAAMDALVHPTYREGFGMVLQEAAAMEVPIVTTRIPGASEVMEEGKSCLLAAPRDVASLLSKMREFSENHKLVNDMGIAARERIEKFFSRPQMIARQLDDYNTMMGIQEKQYMEKIILSTVKMDCFESENNQVVVKTVTDKSIRMYDGNENVIVVIGSRALSQNVATMNFPGLKMYQLTSAGFDHVPVEAFKAKGVAVCNAGSVYSQPIAETVVYGMLQFTKRYWKNPKHHFLRPMRKYRYISELANKKALILGCGNIGTAIAKRLRGFDMDVDGYDPYCLLKSEYGHIYRTHSEMITVLPNYQYVITTLPDTHDTNGSLNAELFNAMSKDAIIVNVGRKAIFNQNDFIDALKERKIAGAVLDMFERIPNPITNPFRRLSNVIVLPGVAALSQEVNVRLKKHIKTNCRLVLNGDEPQCRIG